MTTGGVSATVVVSGSVVQELGFGHEANALGANNRANATVGRFAQMVRYFCGRGGGALHSHGTMGHPGRLSFCIAERPDTVWPAFHTQTGLPEDASVVSAVSTEGPNSINNHYCESGEAVLETIADCMAHFGSTNFYWHTAGGQLIVLGPEHMDLVARQFTRDQARAFLFERARRSTDDLIRLGRIPREPRPESSVERGTMRSPVASESQFDFLESGNPGGKFSAVIPRWVGSMRVISRVID